MKNKGTDVGGVSIIGICPECLSSMERLNADPLVMHCYSCVVCFSPYHIDPFDGGMGKYVEEVLGLHVDVEPMTCGCQRCLVLQRLDDLEADRIERAHRDLLDDAEEDDD